MDVKRTRPFEVSPDLYPFADHWFERDGAAMHYVDEGSGVTVVILHGNPTWSFLYRNVIQQLNGLCRCIAPDLPGFGFSDHPPAYRYTPQEHADWVKAFFESLDVESFVLVVQDWGGPIGFSAAVDMPKRIAGLVILNTWAFPIPVGAWLASWIIGGPWTKFLHLRFNFFARKLLPTGIAKPEKKTPDVLQAYVDQFPTPKSRMGSYVFPVSIRRAAKWVESIEPRLGVLAEKPVEMVWPMKDKAFGKEYFIKRWLKHFPHAHVERVEDASHYIQEDSPESVAAGITRLLERL